MTDQFYVPPGGPPQVESPSHEIYAVMGEEKIFQMLEDFYAELGRSPIAHLFPEGDELIEASKKSGAFFVGLCGGPPLYHQRYGNPMMRARHMPFPIDNAARLEWLACFDRILEDAPEKYQFPAEHLAVFRKFLYGFSTWMVNRKASSSTDDLSLTGMG